MDTLNQLAVAKVKIENVDDLVQAEARATQQEARANRLANDLTVVEDELRALKREHGLDAGFPKLGR